MLDILCVVYFAKDVEDWFAYGKLNDFYISASYLSFNIQYITYNEWITLTSDINNIEYFTYDKY